MKSYNHLWEKYATKDNMYLAIHKAVLGKKKKKYVMKVMKHIERHYDKIWDYAINFKPVKHVSRTIYDGVERKKREITPPCFYEQIVHHMIMNVLIPILSKGMYTHSYASMPNKGVHKGAKYICKYISRNRNVTLYCYKADIKQYFASVNKDILTEQLLEKIHDLKFMKVISAVIDSMPKGLSLGFYTSQWFANFYLTKFDHYVKEVLGADFYIRYMDDIVIFDSDKKKLFKIHKAISDYLNTNLDLEIKKNWQVFRFSYDENGEDRGRFLDFMGFKFYHNRMIIRRSIFLKATRKARRINKKNKTTVHDSRQMLSYNGWLKYTDTYFAYQKMIKPYISFSELKHNVSIFDRRKKLCGENQNAQTQKSH